MSKFLEIFIYCILITILCECVLGQKCNGRGLRRFDANIVKLLTVGNSGRKFPESKGPQLDKYCDESEKLVKSIDAFRNKCMAPNAKQIMGVYMFAFKNNIKEFCKKDSKERDKLIDAAPCANQGNSEIQFCYSHMIDVILGVQNEPDRKKVIPFLCCEAYRFYPCVKNRLKRLSKCTETTMSTLSYYVRKLYGNIQDLFCSEYTEGSEKCRKLGSPPKKRKDQRTKSFAIPMIDIINSFPDI